MDKRSFIMLVFAILMAIVPATAQNVSALKKLPKTNTSTKQVATLKEAKGTTQKKLSATELQKGVIKALHEKKQKAARKKVKAEKMPKRVVKEAVSATPVSVPYEANFLYSSEAFEEDFIVINNNDDLSDGEPCTWKWSGSGGAYYSYNMDGETPADDYLVLPVSLESGVTYEVTVNAATWNYPEVFEVVAGTECSAAGLTTTIIGSTTPDDEPANYSGTFTPETTGTYYVAVHCTSEADKNMLSVYKFVIDVAPAPGSPAAITEFSVEQTPGELKNTITFTAPTQDVSGNDLTGDMTVTVIRNGEVAGTVSDVLPGSEKSFVDEVTKTGRYNYLLYATNNAGKGRTSEGKSVIDVMPKDVPYIVNFEDEDEFNEFTVIDNNGDEYTWEYSSYDSAAKYHYSWDFDGDDYLISNPLNLEAGKSYNVTILAATDGESYTEKFDVVAGMSPTVEGLNISVIGETEVTSPEYSEYTGTFTAAETGVYYVAVHATSAPNNFYLKVSEFKVEKGAEPTAPAAPEVEAVAAEMGEMKANITVTAPTKTVEGKDLTSISKMELYRDDVLVSETNSVTPGGVMKYEDQTFENPGLYKYHAVAYNESGNGLKSEKTNTWVGTDEPAAPETMTAVDNGTSIDFAWSPVTNVGMHGGYVNPDNVTYNIWSLYVSPNMVFFMDKLGSVDAPQTSLNVEMNTDEGEQGYSYFAVKPTNEATQDEDKSDWNAVAVFTGKPYENVAESYTGGELHYFWETNGLQLITSYAADMDNAALALLTRETGTISLVSGKIDTKDAKSPMLVFSALSPNIDKLYIMDRADGNGSWNLIATVNLTDDYNTYQVALPDLIGSKRYGQIAFAAQYNNAAVIEDGEITNPGDFIYLDNIRIGDFADNDLRVNVSAPEKVFAGQPISLYIKVENAGLKDASSYTLKVTTKGTDVINETITEPLTAFDYALFRIDVMTSVYDEAGDLPITVSIENDAEQRPEDNTISGIVAVMEPDVEAPTNLLAESKGKDGVDLAWTAPVTTAMDVTEDFENGPGFFTQIDGNNDDLGWDYIYDDENQELHCHSGYGGMQSYSYINGIGAIQVDNWLVTPKAILDGTFSFWAAGQDPNFPQEHFAVFVSTSGNKDVADFTQVSEEFEATSYPQEYSVDLSSYAGQEGYIAIRHFNCYDMYALVLDDITYKQAPLVPEAYNVYFEKTLIATVEGDKTTYTAAAKDIEDGTHTFGVTAVYTNDKESRPATATVEVTDGISKVITDGNPVDVYTIDGKIVRRQTTNLEGLKGIFVVGGRLIMF